MRTFHAHGHRHSHDHGNVLIHHAQKQLSIHCLIYIVSKEIRQAVYSLTETTLSYIISLFNLKLFCLIF